MAEVTYTQSQTIDNHTLVTWTGVTEADTFQPYPVGPRYSHRVVQIGGTFGGATAVLKGSNDNTTYATLKDMHGTAISTTSAALSEVAEHPLYLKPEASGGVSQSLTVQLLLRR